MFSGRKPARRLQFPLKFSGRIGIFEGGFTPERNTRQLDANDFAGIAAFAPEAIVISLDTALALADQSLRGYIKLPSLQFAVVVLTRIDDTPLAPHHRDLLWRAFAVPVFEQLLDADGRVIARECEVHDGLHLDPLAEHRRVMDTHEILPDFCECGTETPRLKTRC